jgi:hypothetical protein
VKVAVGADVGDVDTSLESSLEDCPAFAGLGALPVDR